MKRRIIWPENFIYGQTGSGFFVTCLDPVTHDELRIILQGVPPLPIAEIQKKSVGSGSMAGSPSPFSNFSGAQPGTYSGGSVPLSGGSIS